jgi:hypothetical protein
VKTKVLVLASGLSANEISKYDYKQNGWSIVVVNNGWRACEDWDYWVRANNYRGDRPTININQIECKKYNHILNEYGGHLACGYSITLCASYYAIHTIKPTVIGYLGADMNYEPDKNGDTHIYGLGDDIKRNNIPDPDRMVEKYGTNDPNYLENIYLRFGNIAKENGCDVVNFSSEPNSRLPYRKGNPNEF